MDALRYDRYSFSYAQGKRVLRDVDWAVPEGAFELLVGATGSGKTTLLRSAKPELAYAGERTGAVSVFGRAIDPAARAGGNGSVGYVGQSPENQITCDSVWHELAFGLENRGVAVDQMRRRVAEVAAFFGIEPWIDRKTADLSGGQKQLVVLASVLVLQPRLLLLDEPTAQLDPVAEKNFLHALFRINREIGITVVVATHAPEAMASYATGCARLENGVLELASGPASASGGTLSGFANGCDAGGACEASVPGERRARRLAESASSRDSGAFCVGGSATSERAIRLKDGWFRYARESAWVLRDTSIEVGRGSIHALVGGNGSGKSTLLALAAGTLRPERGKVFCALADSQAFLPQDPRALFACDTVFDELSEWQGRCGYSDAAICAKLEEAGLADAMRRHPYDLSGGEQQKLAFAKVLLAAPDLLLLDEPTKGLDVSSKLEVAQMLCDLCAGGTTILLATHDLAFADAVADTVSMLFAAEVTCTESPAEFFAGNMFYRPPHDGFAKAWQASHPSPGAQCPVAGVVGDE